MIKNQVWIISLCFLIYLLYGTCRKISPYHQMEARELARSERFDSLFLGIYLGMNSKDFYMHCWELNKKGLIREGSSNTTVYYPIDLLKHPASMEFYPGFHNDSIIEMPVVFSYDAWAPWNKHLFADSLKIDVLHLMEDWYGEGFLEIESPKPAWGNAFVKVEGNRRISIYNLDDSKVKVDLVDLRRLRKLEAMNKVSGDVAE